MTTTKDGPAWSNSLFEDNAEFGLGMRLTLDKQQEYARELLAQCADIVGEELVREILNADQSSETGIRAQRGRMALLKQRLQRWERMEASLPHARKICLVWRMPW